MKSENFDSEKWVNEILNNAASGVEEFKEVSQQDKKNLDFLLAESVTNREKIEKIREYFSAEVARIKKELISLIYKRDTLSKKVKDVSSFNEMTKKLKENILKGAIENEEKNFIDWLDEINSEIEPLEIKPNEIESQKIEELIDSMKDFLVSSDELIETASQDSELHSELDPNTDKRKFEIKQKIKEKYISMDSTMSVLKSKASNLYKIGEEKIFKLSNSNTQKEIFKSILTTHKSNFQNWFDSQKIILSNGEKGMFSLIDSIPSMNEEDIKKIEDNVLLKLDGNCNSAENASKKFIAEVEELLNKIR